MNLYKVTINDEVYNVIASGIMAAIKYAKNEDNMDRNQNNWYSLDREVRDEPIAITVSLEIRNLTQEEVEAFYEKTEVTNNDNPL